MEPIQQTPLKKEQALEAASRRGPTPPRMSRQDAESITRELATLSTKLDTLPEIDEKLEKFGERLARLEIFRGQMKVWGIVGSGIWALALTLIGMKLWA